MIIHLHRNQTSGFIAVLCMFADTLIPAFAPADHLGWLRWRIPLMVLALVAVIALVIQLLNLSKQEYEREERENERDKQFGKLAQYVEKQQSIPPQQHEQDTVSTSSGLRAEDPRVYVSLERTEKRFGGEIFHAPTSVFVLRNEGEREAQKVKIDPLILFKSRADFDTVECLASHQDARVTPRTSERFERNDIVKIMMKEWDEKGELTAEFSKPMRIAYRDFSGRSFQTTFDLTLLPIKEIVYRRLPPQREHYEDTISIRNIEIKPLP